MKKFWCKFGIVFFSLCCIAGISMFFTDDIKVSQIPGIVLTILLCGGLVYLLVKKLKKIDSTQKNKKIPHKSRWDMAIKTKFNHISGLPIPEGAMCKVSSNEESIEIVSGTTNISLNRKKITDMNVMTAGDVQKQAVSSVGGAIAGGLVFGPLGAIIGGRVKTKSIKKSTKCLIITYRDKDGELAYLAFDVDQNSLDAHHLVKEFKKLNVNEGINIEL